MYVLFFQFCDPTQDDRLHLAVSFLDAHFSDSRIQASSCSLRRLTYCTSFLVPMKSVRCLGFTERSCYCYYYLIRSLCFLTCEAGTRTHRTRVRGRNEHSRVRASHGAGRPPSAHQRRLRAKPEGTGPPKPAAGAGGHTSSLPFPMSKKSCPEP